MQDLGMFRFCLKSNFSSHTCFAQTPNQADSSLCVNSSANYLMMFTDSQLKTILNIAFFTMTSHTIHEFTRSLNLCGISGVTVETQNKECDVSEECRIERPYTIW